MLDRGSQHEPSPVAQCLVQRRSPDAPYHTMPSSSGQTGAYLPSTLVKGPPLQAVLAAPGHSSQARIDKEPCALLHVAQTRASISLVSDGDSTPRDEEGCG